MTVTFDAEAQIDWQRDHRSAKLDPSVMPAAIHPADPKCLKLALNVVPKFSPLSAAEAEALKQKAANATPIFRYPRTEKG